MSKLGPEARAILAGGRSADDPTAEDRARVRRAIRRSLAAGGAAAATSGAASAAKGAGATKIGTLSAISAGKVISVVALVSAVAAGSAIQRIVRDPAPPDPRPLPARIAGTPRNAAAPPSGSVEEPGGAGEARGETGGTPGTPAQAAPSSRLDLPPAPAIADPVRSAVRPRASAALDGAPRIESAPSATDPLERETASLEEANRALRGGDPGRALDLLERQSAAYRDGQLREERAAARVLALCKLGRMDEARAAAAAFVRESPRSPLVDRVRAGCPAATR